MNVAAKQATVLKKRHRRDRIARTVITAFGFIVLVTMGTLIWHLFSQSFTVIQQPGLKTIKPVQAASESAILSVGDLANGQAAVLSGPGCGITLARVVKRKLANSQSIRRPCSHELGTTMSYGQNYVVDISGSGLVRLMPVPTVSQPLQRSEQTDESLANEITFSVPPELWSQQTHWQISVGKNWLVFILQTADTKLVQWVNRTHPAQLVQQHYMPEQRILALPDTRQLLLINDNVLTFMDIDNQPVKQLSLKASVTWADTIVKNRSVFVATSDNELVRLSLFNDQGKMAYQIAYQVDLQPNETPIAAYSHASANGLAMITNKQQLLMLNRLSGDIVQRKKLAFMPTGVSWYDHRIYVFSADQSAQFTVRSLAGLSTFNSLLAPQIYEGYAEADQIWQTTSASDYQEAKMNLVPLIMGSIKASLLALMIAIPLALGAAVYTAYFARPRIREGLKPAIEMLEAIPSVLIGFIAAIWLAPLAERFLYSFAVFIVTLPVMLMGIALIQHRAAQSLPVRFHTLAEVILPVLGTVLFGYVCIAWAPELLFLLLDVEDFSFIAHATEVPVGKTTILVAIALGFAISPGIYSLAEDAITGVPASLQQASYALGATRLQTLRRVVLKVAFPGVVAAVMLGFGRACGETMIVLMVTGNTPIADWDLFAGLRALTANLAIELPEAKTGSVHYQVLFLTACVLFIFTFVVNTFAELFRQRLRKVASNA